MSTTNEFSSTANTGPLATSSPQTGDGLDRVAAATGTLGDRLAPLVNELASDAEQLGRRGIKLVQARSEQLRDQVQRAQLSVTHHIREEPVKAVLIAAACGALLAGLLSWWSRSPRAV